MLYGAMNFPVRPLLEEVESVGKLGFDYLEVAMDPPQGHYSVIRRIESVLMRALEQRKLSVVCHLPDVHIQCRSYRRLEMCIP